MRRALMAFVGMIGMLEKINWHNHIAWRLFNPRLQRSIVHYITIRNYSNIFEGFLRARTESRPGRPGNTS